MFLTNLLEQNPEFARAVIDLHQDGRLPPDTYVIDLDTLGDNARLISDESHRLGMEVVAMTKHIGRNPDALDVLKDNGVDSFVAVDLHCARAIVANGHRLGHLGHLSQIPRHSAAEGARLNPEYWTVFSHEKAREVAEASASLGRSQRILARIFGDSDTVLPGREGGFAADDVLEIADRIGDLPGAEIAGITSYPALVFDREQHVVKAAPNLATLAHAAERLASAGHHNVVVNAPGETSFATLGMLADAGVTQVEPGHGFTGTGALHGVAALPERPAMAYLSEVSHVTGDRAYCFGGGLYVCSGSIEYQPTAIVGADFEKARTQRVAVELDGTHQRMDFYGVLDQTPRNTIRPGDSVLFSFRAQAFYTRSMVAGISGIHSGIPRLHGLYNTAGIRPTS